MQMVLFGPPGVGKGTQGSRLAKDLDLCLISTGDLLRQAVRNQTELGVKAKGFMGRGELVPDELVVALIEETLLSQSDHHGFVLDGFPRNEVQANALDDMLDKHGISLDRVVFMDAASEVLVNRLSGRLTCSACGSGFHVHYSPPQKDHLCDHCGSPLMQRDDDKPDVIRSRLDVYQEQTSPLITYYQKHQGYRRVESAGEMDVVFEALKEAVIH